MEQAANSQVDIGCPTLREDFPQRRQRAPHGESVRIRMRYLSQTSRIFRRERG